MKNDHQPIYSVFLVRNNQVNWAAYSELAATLFYGLSSMGAKVTLCSSIDEICGRPIVIGAHVLTDCDAKRLPDDAIIYNTEHANSQFFSSSDLTYIRLLSRLEVWDYNVSNSLFIQNLISKAVKVVPIGFNPALRKVPSSKLQDIDVLFYGAGNERRQKILDQLREFGLVVNHAFAIGQNRDELIARSKIVLNIHYYEPGAFEVSRVTYLLINSKAVVTELNADEVMDEDLKTGVVAVPYEDMVNACVMLVRADKRRLEVEKSGFDAICYRDQAAIMSRALDLLPIHIFDQSLSPSEYRNPLFSIYSCHGTVLYYDVGLARVAHAVPTRAPANLVVEMTADFGRLLYLEPCSGRIYQIKMNDEGWVALIEKQATFDFGLKSVNRGDIAFKLGEKFLSADNDTYCRLNRRHCEAWEQFSLKFVKIFEH